MPPPPCAWQTPFMDTIRQHQHLVAADNPKGTNNNSDLKLAAAITGHATLLASTPSMPFRTVLTGTDNNATHACITRGSISALTPPAYLLWCLHTRTDNTMPALHLVMCLAHLTLFLTFSLIHFICWIGNYSCGNHP